jgi:hypothetical protein
MPRLKNPPAPPVVVNGHDDPNPDAGIVVDDPVIETTTVAEETPQPEDAGVQALRDQLKAKERENAELQSRLVSTQAERRKDEKTIVDSRLAVIESTIKTNETKRDSISKRLKEAKEAGDYDAETAAQIELAEVTLDLKQARMGKDQLETQIEDAKTTPAAPQNEDEKFEAWAKANNVAAESRAWLRDHMDYLTDSYKNAELQLAHQKAIRAGETPNSRGYFEAVERELGLDDEEVVPERRTPTIAPAAPVSRSSSPAGGARVSDVPGITHLGGDKYRVTKEVAEAAQMAGVPIKKYIAEALKLKRGTDGQLH